MMTVKNFEELFVFIAAAKVPADCELSSATSLALKAEYARQKYQEEEDKKRCDDELNEIYEVIQEKGTITCEMLANIFKTTSQVIGAKVKNLIEKNKVVKYRNRFGLICYAVVEI